MSHSLYTQPNLIFYCYIPLATSIYRRTPNNILYIELIFALVLNASLSKKLILVMKGIRHVYFFSTIRHVYLFSNVNLQF